MTELTKLQLETLDRVETLLKNMNCRYVIRLPNGDKRAHNETFRNERKRAPRQFEYGEVRQYISPYVEALQPGQAVVVPCSKYGYNRIQSGLTNIAHHKFGSGNYVTTLRRDVEGVEILRTDGI